MFAVTGKKCHKEQVSQSHASQSIKKNYLVLPLPWKVVQILNIQIASKFFRTSMIRVHACVFLHGVG